MNKKPLLSVRDWLFVGLVLTVGVWSVTSSTATERATSDQAVRTLLDYTLSDAEGRSRRVGEWKGEVLVVNFWATWCRPCKKEMPLLDDLHDRMAAQSGRVIAISVDRDADRVLEFVESNDLSMPVFVDGPEGLIKKLDLAYLPYTFVLDRTGKVVFAGNAAEGEVWAEMTGLVDRLLAQNTNPDPVQKAERAGS